MVPIISDDIGRYINKITDTSLLLKCFSVYLFDDFKSLSTKELNQLTQNKKDYKFVASLGFVTKYDEFYIEKFESGLDWLAGRTFTLKDNIVLDNSALLGLYIGTKYSQNEELIFRIQNWFKDIISLKEQVEGQMPYASFFRKLWNQSLIVNTASELDTELSFFHFFLNDTKPAASNLISEYFLRLRTKLFPYFDGDFFRNIINVYISNHIYNHYILSQNDFENSLNQAKIDEREAIITQIKDVLKIRARNFTDIFFVLIFTVLTAAFLLGAILVWYGDWNYYEPKTYIFGVPFLSYLIMLVITWVTNKEVSFKPKAILDKVFLWKLKRLYNEFKIT